MGMYVRRSAFPASTTYFHANSEAPNDYNGQSGAYTMEVTNYSTDDRTLDLEVYAAVGDLDTVTATLDRLGRQSP